MTYHNNALDLPEAPSDAPLILRVHRDAVARVNAATIELDEQVARVRALVKAGEYTEARRYLATLPRIGVEYNHALQVIEHGDLNVDALVIEQIPDSGWVNMAAIERTLVSYDARLGAALYRPSTTWQSGRTAVDVVIDRLVEEEHIKLHSNHRQVRRFKPNEKRAVP